MKISFSAGIILSIESVLIYQKPNFVLQFFVFLIILNILVGIRILIRQLIREALNSFKENVLVYGDAEAAIDFANAIAFGKKYRVAGIVTDPRHSKVHFLVLK